MYKLGLIEEMVETFEERRESNKSIPIEAILVLAISAKLQRLCAVTDITAATMDVDILEKIGYEMKVKGEDILSEGEIRAFVNKYTAEDLIDYYNQIAQKVINKMKYDEEQKVHQHDSTDLEVKLKNANYEKSEVTKGKDGKYIRGYKLNCCRMMLEQGGLIERISMTSAKVHDLESSRKMLEEPYHIKENDTLVYDRGYIDRHIINNLKKNKKISVIVPAKKNMDIFDKALKLAKKNNCWEEHPNSKRKGQKISLIKGLGGEWSSIENVWKKKEKENGEDVELNACVIRISKNSKQETEEEITQIEGKYKYIVLLSSDTSLTGAQIIRKYETRPEIEEDFRQLKDVWGLKNFKSTKYLFIVFHIVMMLLGYMFYIVYKNTEEGEKYKNKSLETILKNYKKKWDETMEPVQKLIVFWKKTFGIIEFTEFLDIYADSTIEIRGKIKKVIKRPIW